MIDIRRADTRGVTSFDWLDSKHSFSFGEYWDPDRMGLGSLRVLNDDVIAPGAGFPRHPHADMEIVTYVLSGALEHRDSTGGHGVIRAGEVQHMTAGKGIAHSEFNASQTEPVHLLQIWFVPDKRGYKPGYEQKSFATEIDARRNELTRVVSGKPSNGELAIHQDADMLVSRFDAGKNLSHDVKKGRAAFVHVVSGEVELGGQKLGPGDEAVVAGETLELATKKKGEVVVFDVSLEK